MGFLITLNSNGTLIDEKTVQWLKKCPPVRINISLYGASNETYKRLCGNPQGFTQTTNAVRLLKEAGIAVKLNCSLTPHNAGDLKDMVAYARENDLILQVATYMFPPVRKDGQMVGKNNRFSPEEAAYYMAYADYLQMGRERFLAQESGFPVLNDPQEQCGQIGDGVRCRAGKCSFWITWQGQMLSCGMFPAEGAPNVFKMPFSNAWELVKERTQAIRLPAPCADCSAKDSCHACAAMVITESGCFHKVPEYRCRMIHAYQAQYNRVKEEML